jgi:type II secretion system protein G
MLRGLRRDRRGFTLIELVVVITILGVLVALAIPAVGGYVDNAKRKAAKADAKNLQTALVLYASQNGNFPSSLADYGQLQRSLQEYLSLPSTEGGATFYFGGYSPLSADNFRLWIYAKDTGHTDIYIYKHEIIEVP